jgi:hypothetical protein
MTAGAFTMGLARLWIRRSRLYSVDIPTALSQGGPAIVCLPEDPSLAEDALRVCDELSAWFGTIHPLHITASKEPVRLPIYTRRIIAVERAVNYLGFPVGEVVRQTKNLAPMVALDLNPSFRLATALLCVQSGAALRIGLRTSEPGFFNLEYNWPENDGLTLSEHYGRMLEFFDHVRASSAQ